jgi:hypothetical protein
LNVLNWLKAAAGYVETSAANPLPVQGGPAHDAADSGSPIKLGGKASATTTIPTAVSAADRVDGWLDLNGRLVVLLDKSTNGPNVFSVIPTLDTSIYADGDSMCAIVEIANFVRAAGETCILNSLVVNDEDDQGIAFEVFFFDRTATLPAVNAAWNVSDADMANCLGYIPVAAADYNDLGGNRIAVIKNIGLPMKPNATSLFMALRSRGAGTYTAAGVTMKLGTV